MVSNNEKHPALLYIYLAVIAVTSGTIETHTHHKANHERTHNNDNDRLDVDIHLEPPLSYAALNIAQPPVIHRMPWSTDNIVTRRTKEMSHYIDLSLESIPLHDVCFYAL